MNGHQSAEIFARTLQKLELEDRITYIKERFNRVLLVSNLQVPDQLLTWILTKRQKQAEIALGSDKTPSQAQKSLMDVTLDRYGVKIKSPPNLAGVLPAFDAVIAYTGHLDDGAPFVRWDSENEQFIFNPLADWNAEKIIGAILEHEIPVNYPLDIVVSDDEVMNTPLHFTTSETTDMQSRLSAR